jgi:hypothetical protein
MDKYDYEGLNFPKRFRLLKNLVNKFFLQENMRFVFDLL